MKNTDFENFNNFKIHNEVDIFVLFYNRANITDEKTRKMENISFSQTFLKFSAGNQPL